MSIDTTFKPIGLTTLVGTSAVQASPDPTSDSRACTTFRVRCLVAAYLTWGSQASVTAAGAPGAGTPVNNTIGMSIVGEVEYLEIPYASYFISSVAASFEITPGIGGTG